jgi:hypothetical protein
MIRIIGLDETVVGKLVRGAILYELVVGGKIAGWLLSRFTTSMVELATSK